MNGVCMHILYMRRGCSESRRGARQRSVRKRRSVYICGYASLYLYTEISIYLYFFLEEDDQAARGAGEGLAKDRCGKSDLLIYVCVSISRVDPIYLYIQRDLSFTLSFSLEEDNQAARGAGEGVAKDRYILYLC